MAIHKENHYQSIREKLHQFRQHGKRTLIWEGLFNCLSVCFVASLGLLLAEAMLWMQPNIRSVLLIGIICLGFCGMIIWIVKPLYSYYFLKEFPSDIELALRIGTVFPHIKDRLGDALQVFERRKNEAYRTSPVLAEMALKTTYENVQNLDFRQVVLKDRVRQALRLFIITLTIFIICFRARMGMGRQSGRAEHQYSDLWCLFHIINAHERLV